MLRTGASDVEDVIDQIYKHLTQGLYNLISLNVSKASCVVVFSTQRPREELLWRNGFPWDVEDKS